MDHLDRTSAAKQNRDWFTISVDTLRAWGVLALVVVLGLAGYAAYKRWNLSDLERRANEMIADASNLKRQLEANPGRSAYPELWTAGSERLGGALTALGEQDFEQAMGQARQSRNSFEALLSSLASAGGGKGDATFSTVEGTVEYRRGQSANQSWEEAKERTVLHDGDSIRTAEGSAEVILADGTQYTVRPNTQLVIRAKSARNPEPAIGMEYGWVDLATSRQGSRVSTPGAEARVGDRSEAMVTYDADTQVGQYAAYTGGLEVQAKNGDARTVEPMEQVTLRGNRLGAPERLPPAPEHEAPVDSVLLDLDRTAELQLRWAEAVPGGSYGLQIARDRLFTDRVVDVSKRAKTSARLSLRAEGTYYWRVQSISSGGGRGPWSDARTFRVHKDQGLDGAADTSPPELALERVKRYGNIFLVGGRTEPGCSVRVNGEPVDVGADGSFTKTIQIDKEGWNQLEVRARDAAGNEASAHPRVFVEIL